MQTMLSVKTSWHLSLVKDEKGEKNRKLKVPQKRCRDLGHVNRILKEICWVQYVTVYIRIDDWNKSQSANTFGME